MPAGPPAVQRVREAIAGQNDKAILAWRLSEIKMIARLETAKRPYQYVPVLLPVHLELHVLRPARDFKVKRSRSLVPAPWQTVTSLFL